MVATVSPDRGHVALLEEASRLPGTDDLMAGLHELHDARDEYDRAWDMWRGKAPEVFSSNAMQKAMARSSGMYRINIAKVPITVLLDRLKVAAVTALTELGEKDDAADEGLQAVYEANKVTLLRTRLYRNTLVYGDGYTFTWQGTDDPLPQIRYNSPLTTRLLYDPEDDTVPVAGIKSWKQRGITRATLLYADHIEPGWYCQENGDPKDPGSWLRDPELDDVAHDYGRIPLIHWRTDMPYGVPDHEDAWGPQEAIQKLSTTLMHSSEALGAPARYALQSPNADLSGEAADNPIWDDELDGDTSTQDNSRIRNGPGEIALLKGMTGVGQWDAAKPDGFTSGADWYMGMAAISTGTPQRHLTGRGDAPSGASLRVADAPLAGRTETRQHFFDDSEREQAQLVLRILGYPQGRINVRWKPAGIVDDMTTWEICNAKINAGVPPRVALAETGLYEADEIDAWLADASVEMSVERRAYILSDIASAMSGLAQAQATGLLSEEQARAVVSTTIGQLTPAIEVTPQ